MAGPQFPFWMVQNVGAAGQPSAQAAAPLEGMLGRAGESAYGMYGQYAPGLMANAAQQGQTSQNMGNQLSGAYAPLQSGASSVMNTAFDPQSELYNRTAQQLRDQTRAALSARGIAMSPYGAGVEGRVMSDFDIDWQNQQLQRQLAGLGGAGTALGQYGQGVIGGQGLAQSGAQFPVQQMSGLFGAQNQGLAPAQQAIGDYISQQQLAQQAAQAQNDMLMNIFNIQQGQYNQGQNRQNQMFGGLGQLAGGLAGYLL